MQIDGDREMRERGRKTDKETEREEIFGCRETKSKRQGKQKRTGREGR